MPRAGKTQTLTISLARGPLAVLRRRAKQTHRGNLSAAVAEALEFLRRDMAMGELVADLEKRHGPLTAEERAEFAAETAPKPPRRKRVA